MPENSEEFLSSWRGALPGHEVRTVWSDEHGCWVCVHRLSGGEEISEMLPVDARERQDEALLAELRSLNICAPLIVADSSHLNGTARVFNDGEYWSSWHPCPRCGGFAWRLRLQAGIFGNSELGGALERELARLLAHRAVFLHGIQRPAEECVGCLEKDILSGRPGLGDRFAWFSSESQEWLLRLRVDGDTAADLPLGLPSWTSGAELQSEIRRVIALGEQGPPPFDWQQEGGI
jgi:hypothetical protein